jgi:hypothetical protein
VAGRTQLPPLFSFLPTPACPSPPPPGPLCLPPPPHARTAAAGADAAPAHTASADPSAAHARAAGASATRAGTGAALTRAPFSASLGSASFLSDCCQSWSSPAPPLHAKVLELCAAALLPAGAPAAAATDAAALAAACRARAAGAPSFAPPSAAAASAVVGYPGAVPLTLPLPAGAAIGVGGPIRPARRRHSCLASSPYDTTCVRAEPRRPCWPRAPSAGRRSHRGPSWCRRSSYGSRCSLLVAPSCGRRRSCSLHRPFSLWRLYYLRHLGSLSRDQCIACCGPASSFHICTSLLLSMCLGHSSAAHGQDTSRCTLLASRRPCSLAPLPSVGFHPPRLRLPDGSQLRWHWLSVP